MNLYAFIVLLCVKQHYIVLGEFDCIYSSPSYDEGTSADEMYLDLLQNVVTGLSYAANGATTLYHGIGYRKNLRKHNLNMEQRVCGMDLPLHGITMVGLRRLELLKEAIIDVVQSNITGDIVECGVWQGGASAYAIGVLKTQESKPSRRVWLVDSFSGFPQNPIEQDSETLGLPLNAWSGARFVEVAQLTVEQNLRNLGLMDHERTSFLKGYFSETLPSARGKIGSISVLRMDGDMYESSMDILYNLYPSISKGGWVIIDDWWLDNCQRAIKHFRNKFNITEPIIMIDFSSAYWIKLDEVPGIYLKDWETEKLNMTKAGKRQGILSLITDSLKILVYLLKTILWGGQSDFMPNSVQAI